MWTGLLDDPISNAVCVGFWGQVRSKLQSSLPSALFLFLLLVLLHPASSRLIPHGPNIVGVAASP